MSIENHALISEKQPATTCARRRSGESTSPRLDRPPSLLAEALASSRRHETRSDRQSGYRRAIPFRALRSSDRPRPGPSLPWRTTRPVSSRRTPAFEIASTRRSNPGLLLPCSSRGARCAAAPLAPGHPRERGQALDRSAAADALPLQAALLHLDTDFELHRLPHSPGNAAVSRPTTRRVSSSPSERLRSLERRPLALALPATSSRGLLSAVLAGGTLSRGISVLLILAPGPDMVLVAKKAVLHGSPSGPGHCLGRQRAAADPDGRRRSWRCCDPGICARVFRAQARRRGLPQGPRPASRPSRTPPIVAGPRSGRERCPWSHVAEVRLRLFPRSHSRMD